MWGGSPYLDALLVPRMKFTLKLHVVLMGPVSDPVLSEAAGIQEPREGSLSLTAPHGVEMQRTRLNNVPFW